VEAERKKSLQQAPTWAPILGGTPILPSSPCSHRWREWAPTPSLGNFPLVRTDESRSTRPPLRCYRVPHYRIHGIEHRGYGIEHPYARCAARLAPCDALVRQAAAHCSLLHPTRQTLLVVYCAWPHVTPISWPLVVMRSLPSGTPLHLPCR
jgi:hypothetical protein